jgi:asparagine synthase (glutamine-hydrolysing)
MTGHLAFADFALERPDSGCEVLCWDGRLDNRSELEGRLHGALRGARTDQAVAGAAYQTWGVAGLRELVGDWSLVIRDPHQRAVILASDYAGVRPLYYCHDATGVSWSTRLDALVAVAGDQGLDERYVAGFLTFGGCPTLTPYIGISSVPAGHAVSITARTVVTNPFWSPPTSDRIVYQDERRYDEQLRHLFVEAVTVRLQTHGPVLAELSGGLDSSSVVCVANQLIRSGAVPAREIVPISYVHRESLDLPFIDELERFCGIAGVRLSTHDQPLVRDDDVGTALPQAWTPLQKSVAATAARVGARVCLTGQNGDLAMGNWFDDSLQVAGALRHGHLAKAMRQSLAWSKVLRVPVGTVLWRAVRAAMPARFAPLDVYAVEGGTAPNDRETSLRREFAERTGAGDAGRWMSGEWLGAPPERRAHFRALGVMRDLRILQPFEPMHDIDYTHPFSHRPLIEFLMSIPADVLCGPGDPRRLMRRALSEFWPPRLRQRRSKSLFGAPWFEALTPLARRLLATPHWHVVERGWAERASLERRLVRLTRGLDCNESQLRHLIILEFWLRNRARRHASSANARLERSVPVNPTQMEKRNEEHWHVA